MKKPKTIIVRIELSADDAEVLTEVAKGYGETLREYVEKEARCGVQNVFYTEEGIKVAARVLGGKS